MLRCHEDAFARIDEVARNPRDGALLVIGDPGAGKSSVLAAAAERHPDISVVVPINPGEGGWPLSGLSTIVAAVGDPRAAEFTGRFALRDDGAATLAGAAGELLGVLRGLDLPRTLLLVDDIDRMDPDSRAIVGYMAGHLTGSGIRLVATASEPPLEMPLAGLPAVAIDPLTAEDAARLAPPGIDPGTLEILVAGAGGNAGTLAAMLAALTPEQLHGRDALRIPARPGPAAWAALERVTRRLGTSHTDALDRLATAPLHPRFAVGAWGEDAEDALQELLDLGLAREAGAFVALADPLVRAALSDALPSRARRELHERMLASCGPLLFPWHRSWADPAADVRMALMASAVEAARLEQPWAAVEFADRAVRSGREGLAPALVELAEELLALGRPALADRSLRLAATDATAGADERLRLAIARLRVEFLAGRGGDVEAELDGTVPDLGRRWTALHAAVAAARGERADPPDEPPAGSSAATAGAARAARALLRHEVGVAPEGVHDPLLLALHARAADLAQDYALGRSIATSIAGEAARDRGIWPGWRTALAIDGAARSGRIGEALELARAHEAGHPHDPGPPGMVPIGVWARLAAGDLDAADVLLGGWNENAVSRVGPLPAAEGLVLRAELARLREQPDVAGELLLLADTVAAGIEDPAHSRHLPALVESLAMAGRSGAAQSAARRLESAAAAHPSRWATLAVARTAVSTARDDEVGARYEQALRL
ncbi:hypothetical protein FJ656_12030, partial [Schumannella luteola]